MLLPLNLAANELFTAFSKDDINNTPIKVF